MDCAKRFLVFILIMLVFLCGCTEQHPAPGSLLPPPANTILTPQHTYISPPSHTSDSYRIVIGDYNAARKSVLISNNGTAVISIYGWKITTEPGNSSFEIPACSLGPGETVTVYLNKTGENTRDALYTHEGFLEEPVTAIYLHDESDRLVSSRENGPGSGLK